MKIKTSDNDILHGWLGEFSRFDLDGEHELDDAEYARALAEAVEQHPKESDKFHRAWAAWTILTRNKVSKQFTDEHGDAATSELAKWAKSAEAQSKAFNLLRGEVSAVADAYSKEANNLGQIFSAVHDLDKTVKDRSGMLARVIAGGVGSIKHEISLVAGENSVRDEQRAVREKHRDILDWAWKLAVLGLLTLFAVRGNAQNTVTQLRFGSTTLGSGYIDTGNTAIEVSCVVGCAGGTSDTDDGSVASGQSTGIQIGLGHVYNGAAWVRMIGDATNGLTVQCATGCSGGTQYTEDAAAAANPIGSAINLVRQDTPAGLVSTDGDNVAQRGTNYGAAYVQVVSSAGAFVDTFGGGTQYAVDAALGATPTGTLAIAIRDDALSALTPVEGDAIGLRVDANGALWVIPSGTTIVGDGAGALNVIVDSGSITANAGTNLNTSLLALEAGGNLATVAGDTTDIEAAVELMDNVVSTIGTTTYTEATSQGNIIAAVRRDADTSAVNTDNEAAPLLVNAIGALKVEIFDGGDSHTVDGTVTANLAAGTNNIGDVDVLSIAAGNNNIGDVDVASITGQTAEDTAGAGAELLNRLGCLGNDADGTPFSTSGTDGDYTHVACDRNGALMVTGQHPDQWSYHENSSSALTDTTVAAACGAGLFNYIGTLAFSSGAATQMTLLIEDSTTTTILGPYYLEAVSGRGAVINFNPPKKQTTSNTLISVTTTGAIAHSIDITGFCAP